MPLTKLAYERFLIIDRCLKTLHYPSKERIMEEIRMIQEVSFTTFYRDLQIMRTDEVLGFMAPIEYDRVEKGYYYTDPNYSINKFAYSSDHLEAIALARGILESYSQLPLLQSIYGLLDRITSQSGVHYYDEDVIERILPDIQPEKAGTEHLGRFIHALKNREVLQFSYTKYIDNSISYPVFSVCALKEFRRRWYAVGHTEQRKALRIYGLDRVGEIGPLPHHAYVPINDFDPNHFFRYTIGITANPESEVMDITLQFQRAPLQYVKSVPIHWTQEVSEENSQYGIVKLQLIESYELIEKILGYGAGVKVLQPASLASKVSKTLREAAQQYAVYS